MNWIYLALAVVFELGWPLGFKLSNVHEEQHWLWLSVGMLSYLVSGVLLYLAQRTMPVSTAYVIWTGASAVGTLLMGIFCFGDSASLLRLLFVFLILVGIVGLGLLK